MHPSEDRRQKVAFAHWPVSPRCTRRACQERVSGFVLRAHDDVSSPEVESRCRRLVRWHAVLDKSVQVSRFGSCVGIIIWSYFFLSALSVAWFETIRAIGNAMCCFTFALNCSQRLERLQCPERRSGTCDSYSRNSLDILDQC